MGTEYKWKDPRPSRAQKAIPRSAHGHFVVQMVIGDCEDDFGQVSRCGSLAEYYTRMIVLAERDTVDVLEQVGPLNWIDEKGRQREHYLDHVVLKLDDRKVGLSNKPFRRVSQDFGDELAQVLQDGQAKKVIDELFLVTEYAHDPVVAYNAELMRACRDADKEADTEASTAAASIDEPTTLAQLTNIIGLGPRGFRALVRMIQAGDLIMKVEEKISHDSLVLMAEDCHD
ncbi:hypothetical protein [Sulfitobacter dubius]|uniref:Uncharacterized protein n=1 Tax=Sulfitobacter dubius TaxID=218673 RepID=A0ABY3ZK53_9RHOB|nr:hypothetical protein [Sulfitobacter dubius]UOA14971.1 hypothetical protein DSM109990_01790 [Sulfitobacter dubius]